jgi:hypothetical protein
MDGETVADGKRAACSRCCDADKDGILFDAGAGRSRVRVEVRVRGRRESETIVLSGRGHGALLKPRLYVTEIMEKNTKDAEKPESRPCSHTGPCAGASH